MISYLRAVLSYCDSLISVISEPVSIEKALQFDLCYSWPSFLFLIVVFDGCCVSSHSWRLHRHVGILYQKALQYVDWQRQNHFPRIIVPKCFMMIDDVYLPLNYMALEGLLHALHVPCLFSKVFKEIVPTIIHHWIAFDLLADMVNYAVMDTFKNLAAVREWPVGGKCHPWRLKVSPSCTRIVVRRTGAT